MHHEEQWSAIHLVEMLSDYLTMCPDTRWEMPEAYPPLEIRLKRIRALSAALALPDDISTVVSGSFLTTQHISYDDALTLGLDLFEASRSQHPWPDISKEGPGIGLQMTFRSAFSLRQKLSAAFAHGVLENSVFELLSVSMSAYQQARDHLAPTLTKLDRFLGHMLDPQGRLIPLEQLVQEWGWPQDDLWAVDLEYY